MIWRALKQLVWSPSGSDARESSRFEMASVSSASWSCVLFMAKSPLANLWTETNPLSHRSCATSSSSWKASYSDSSVGANSCAASMLCLNLFLVIVAPSMIRWISSGSSRETSSVSLTRKASRFPRSVLMRPL